MSALVLASASPRRLELLETLGELVLVQSADIDESPRPGETAQDLVARLAMSKARTVAARLSPSVGDIVIGADTVVTIDGQILGKPADEADAVDVLSRLSGRSHQVMTGVAVLRGSDGRAFVETTTVQFAELSPADIDRYVATGEPLDKAGAYGIQGGAGRFVLSVHGSYQNIVGLPVAQVAAALAELRSGGPER